MDEINVSVSLLRKSVGFKPNCNLTVMTVSSTIFFLGGGVFTFRSRLVNACQTLQYDI